MMNYLRFLLFCASLTYSIGKPVGESEVKNDYSPLDISNQLLSAVSEKEKEVKKNFSTLDLSKQLLSAVSQNDEGDYYDDDNEYDDEFDGSQFIIALGGGKDLESQFPDGLKIGGVDAIKNLKGLDGLEDLNVLDQFDGEIDEEARGPIKLPLEDVDQIIEIEIFQFDEDLLDSDVMDAFDFNMLKK